MSNLSITEYGRIGKDRGFGVQAAAEPALTRQNVTFSAGSVQSADFNSKAVMVRVVADADCRIAFGDDPTADDNSSILPAGDVEYFGLVRTNQMSTLKIAVKPL